MRSGKSTDNLDNLSKDIHTGEVLQLKKTHPCGGNQWQIIRTGADIKIKCLICNRILMMSRSELERKLSKNFDSSCTV
tara:strand:+ start:387 stop:620 length:234 start_codon:yes stop_codon:yes gene_type:complete